MTPAIKIENLGKKYTIKHEHQTRYSTLRDQLSQSVRSIGHRLRHPLQPVQHSDRTEQFWALKDINFEIQPGDRVGIIGRNGAGKSTLLKILSRITAPTTGKVTINGRVASLLEVGTGFHPELSGRENIFLNGAVLGMRKHEIKKKFDEIVDFAEVEQFLDTPVKHYSSGMYVRLAFAVAAHLEPEILILDEVLAVGDAQFQRKCLEKMKETNVQGKTILFVSHNMGAISSLCERGILLDEGLLKNDTDIDSIIEDYLSINDSTIKNNIEWYDNTQASAEIIFKKAYITNQNFEHTSVVSCQNEFSICVEYDVIKPLRYLRIGFLMKNNEGIIVCGSNDPAAWKCEVRNPASYISKCTFPAYSLNEGKYYVNFGADCPPYQSSMITTPYCLAFNVEDIEGHWPTHEKLPGILRPKLNWIITKH